MFIQRVLLYGWHILTGVPIRLATDANGVLQVSGNSTVSGTVTANAGTNLNTSLLALETGGNLASIKSKTDNIPTSPSQEHTTASSPNANRLSDGSSFYKATTPSDTQPISATALPIPTGAATSAKQDTLDTSVNTLLKPASTLAAVTTVGGITNAVTIINAGITSIDGKVPALGQALAASSVPVILPSATITTLTPPAAITGFSTAAKQDTLDTSINTLLKPASTLAAVTTITNITNPVAITNAGITSIDSKVPVLGQALAASSVPVILPVATITTLTPPAAITGFATSTKQSDGSQKTQVVDGAGNVIGATANAIDINIKSGSIPTGSNAIGKLVANSGVDIGDVDVLSQPARAATTDTITAKLATDAIQNGVTALTPKFAFANIAASQTDSNIVTAVTSKKIRVLSLACVTAATATNITFNSKPAGAGTAKTCLFANAANGGEILPFSPVGWFETASGEGLTVTTGSGSTTGVQVVYIEV